MAPKSRVCAGAPPPPPAEVPSYVTHSSAVVEEVPSYATHSIVVVEELQDASELRELQDLRDPS